MLDLWGWEAIEDEIKLAGYVRWALFTLHYLLVAFRGKMQCMVSQDMVYSTQKLTTDYR